jgi:hypothetical protein
VAKQFVGAIDEVDFHGEAPFSHIGNPIRCEIEALARTQDSPRAI